MSQVTKKVNISLTTVIKENNEDETIQATYEGTYKRGQNIEVITFLESNEAFGHINYRIVIRPNKVHVIRSGKLSFQQRFHLDEETESLYKHPYGNILMLTHTKKIQHKSLSNGHNGQLEIVYNLSVNEEETKEHHLDLVYMEET